MRDFIIIRLLGSDALRSRVALQFTRTQVIFIQLFNRHKKTCQTYVQITEKQESETPA